MIIKTERMISVTELQKELTQKLRELSDTGEALYILKNNTMTAVMVSSEEYELLKEAEEIVEHFGIAEIIDKRIKRQSRSENIPWEKVKEKYGL